MNKPLSLLFSFITLFACWQAEAQNSGSLSGFVINAANKQPLQGSTIVVQPGGQSAISDSLGRYRITGIPAGPYTISASNVGFAGESRFNVVITSGNENEISFELQPAAAGLAEVTIRSNRRTARANTLETPLSVQRLTAEEIKANPGGNFDISRVVNSLPGVGGSAGSVGGFRNDIIVRGGGPGENVFYLDGIEIPVVNHFATQGSGGGPTGILNVSFIEDVKLSSSAFHARYDNALSSVFEFRQKTGNPTETQGNVRLSGTELAATIEGPLSRDGKLTYLASARRSYLQVLFSLIDLPIRPNFWDFQYKLSYRPDAKSTLTFLGVGAIDQFGFGKINEPTQDKLYTLNQTPAIRQKSYAIGASYRRSVNNGYLVMALSRNALDNQIEKFDFNDDSDPANLRYRTDAVETENKLRIELNKNKNGWSLSYGAMAQYLQYESDNNIRRRAAVGSQPEDRFLFSSDINFFRFGAFTQAGRKFFGGRLGLSAGLRTDINTFTNDGTDPGKALSPRVAVSYVLADKWTLNATAGRYARIVPYTVLGFRDNSGRLVNLDNNYVTNIHYAAGAEFLPKTTTRFTLEGFYKKYDRVPVTVRDGISINNLGADFGSVGNEPVVPTGRGEAYGIEFFAQQKLTRRFFGLLSYTFFYSRFSNADGRLVASAWDNRHLLSLTFGYKLPRNWELGLKYRYQGGAPYTPFDLPASRQNFLTQGQGLLDYSRFNTLRLDAFSASDIRIDKKWNFRKLTLDIYLDVSNWWGARSVAYPNYALQRDLATGAYLTTNGQPIAPDASNGIPIILNNDDPVILPTIGFIIEF
ncbi:MAG TPA: TonB-dependent receptor [Flavisolibacter sp.]|nr:TonB-dependent receptor [Flavisolibacter sp.]